MILSKTRSKFVDYGSLIPLKELELYIPADDDSIIQTLKNDSYACIFTEDNIDDDNSTTILANGMTMDEPTSQNIKEISEVKTFEIKLSLIDEILVRAFLSWVDLS